MEKYWPLFLNMFLAITFGQKSYLLVNCQQQWLFYLEDIGNGHKFYLPENQDSPDVWGDEITRIFIGVDLTSGFYMVEGSSMLYDELRAFEGIDKKDLESYVVAADYIGALKRLRKLDAIIADAGVYDLVHSQCHAGRQGGITGQTRK